MTTKLNPGKPDGGEWHWREEFLGKCQKLMKKFKASPEAKEPKDFLDIAVDRLYADLEEGVLTNFRLVSVYEDEFKQTLRLHMARFLRAHWPDVQKLPWRS